MCCNLDVFKMFKMFMYFSATTFIVSAVPGLQAQTLFVGLQIVFSTILFSQKHLERVHLPASPPEVFKVSVTTF